MSALFDYHMSSYESWLTRERERRQPLRLPPPVRGGEAGKAEPRRVPLRPINLDPKTADMLRKGTQGWL